MRLRQIALFAAVGVIIISAFVSGTLLGYHNRPAAEKVLALTGKSPDMALDKTDFSPFWEAWNVIDERYVSTEEEVTNQDRVWGAIEGMTASLGDPYTVFLPPEQAELFEEDISGNFGGVGMEVGMRQDILTIIAPLKGSPAERAGLLPDDKIIEIDGESTAGLSIDEAVYRIRGEIGTDVKLTLLRDIDKGAFDVTITRDTINVPVIDTEIITPEENPDKPVFVVSLYSFTANSPGLFQDALREFAESGSTRLILDLRGNPGGYMEAAVEMASWFLPSGKIVVKEIAGKEKEERVHRSRGYNVFNDSLEMVILVNKGSASASEILAGALSEHGVAQIIGTKTFGKGSVQELIHITPDASLKITVSRWFTPNGISISEEGLSPDIEVDVTEEDIEGGRDPQMDRAVAELIKI